jgi:hypothetical protein
MAKERKTGLGDFLFGRESNSPVPPQRSEADYAPEVDEPQQQVRADHENRPIPEPQGYPPRTFRRPTNRRVALKALRDKCTIYLEPDVNQELDVVSRVEQKMRSEVVNDILRQYLPHYDVRRQ